MSPPLSSPLTFLETSEIEGMVGGGDGEEDRDGKEKKDRPGRLAGWKTVP